MLVGNWMTKNPVSIGPETSMSRATKVMNENNIRGLCVVDDEGYLLGIVTDRDIKEASPSQATTLDTHELYYLLSKIRVKNIMSANLVTIAEDDSVEKAAVELLDHKIGGLPVVTKDNKLVGIITQSDVFQVLISITGVRHGGYHFSIELPDEQGSLGQLIAVFNKHAARIMSVLTAYEPEGSPVRRVFIRVQNMADNAYLALSDELHSLYKIFHARHEEAHPFHQP